MRFQAMLETPRRVGPGLVASLVIAAAATFLSQHYGAPVMLFALLLGMAMNFLGDQENCRPGLDLAGRKVLRIGVALLGFRITAGQIAELGVGPVALTAAAVTLTIVFSVLLAWAMGFNRLFGLLSGGATAICGASAALALSAALPAHPMKERATAFTIVGVSTLSTLAMILYPTIAAMAGLDAVHAGLFIGGTIHDVAQVVGAGYGISPEAGDAATLVKLLRVAMLVPAVLVAGLVARRYGPAEGGKRPPLLPGFVLVFMLLVAIGSLVPIPAAVRDAGTALSSWALVAAMAAIGVKTRLGDILALGWKPVLLMIAETLFIALIVFAALVTGLV
ncbi:MAG TPA: putative sulfate exporter family transporter [Allosphingosinicella sp.]